jgi:hypothetical protein
VKTKKSGKETVQSGKASTSQTMLDNSLMKGSNIEILFVQ